MFIQDPFDYNLNLSKSVNLKSLINSINEVNKILCGDNIYLIQFKDRDTQ